ncbi:hypothetical protein V7100_03810 [Priestia megaterium]
MVTLDLDDDEAYAAWEKVVKRFIYLSNEVDALEKDRGDNDGTNG